MTIRLCGFDIGKLNFATYVEDVKAKDMIELEKEYNALPSKYQRTTKGKMNKYIETILQKLYRKKKIIFWDVVRLVNDDEIKPKAKPKKKPKKDDDDAPKKKKKRVKRTKEPLSGNTRDNIMKYILLNKAVFQDVDVFIIENQFVKMFGGRGKSSMQANFDAIRLSEVLYGILRALFPASQILFFNSAYKTHMLGAEGKLDKDQRKEWCEEKAMEVVDDMEEKNEFDEDELKILPGIRILKKKDDACDAMMETQAFKFKYFVAVF